jgi:thiamine biosynthesis lipoprotein
MNRQGIASAIASVLLGACTLCGEVEQVAPAAEPEPRPEPVSVINRGISALGTLFEITVVGRGAAAEQAIQAAFAEVRRVEDLLTTWKPEAPLARVNEAAGGKPVSVPAEVMELIERSIEVSKRTGGAFDVTFASMGKLWDFGVDAPSLPDPREVARRIKLIDFRKLELDRENGTVRLARKGMRLSLGAVAKGYAADRAGAVLRERGHGDFIVFGGGDLLVSGSRGAEPWSVGIQDPRKQTRRFAKLTVPEGGAVVTSGDYERFFVVDGKRYHHIINPRTGFPAQGAISVTVLAPDAILADALATGVFVLGPDEGMALIESDPQLEAIIVDDELDVHVSSGLKRRVDVSPIDRSGEG